MRDDDARTLFEQLALPHLDAAYNLARWLLHNDHDAQDVVQDAMLRALRYIGSCRPDEAKAWVLQIVRNCCYSWIKQNRPKERIHASGEDEPWDHMPAPANDEPETMALRNATCLGVNQAIASLPVAYRDVLVLREFEELSYADIARVTGTPIGTVMSRLARSRAMLRQALSPAEPAMPRTARSGS